MLNWVDLAIIAVLLFFIWEGFGRPLAYEIYDLGSFLLALVFSFRFYNLAAKQLEVYFSLPHSLANVLGFIAVWYAVEIILFALARFIFSRLHKYLAVPGEGALSVIPAFLRGLVFISLILVLIATFPLQPKVKKDVRDSRIGSAILNQAYRLEEPVKNVFGGLTNDTLTFLTIHPESNEKVNLGFQTGNYHFDHGLEMAMFNMVNKERTSRGLPALTYDPVLQQIARDHSADMFARGYFSHYSPEGKNVADRAQMAGYGFTVIGENLAYAPSLELAHQGLMNSPGHRANILSADYQKIGIGAAVSDEYGIMFTQNFSN